MCVCLFDFPNDLQEIFDYLNKNGAKPIVVGGYVRDRLFGLKKTKDIDIEVYNISSYEKLTALLEPFGKVNVVGKSFGVCKLKLKSGVYDFSLPRTETKTAQGHKGFRVHTNASLSFKEGAKRRDFSINAIGYNPATKQLLDPYGGLKDIQTKTLRYIDKKTFQEDPLRVLRGAVFYARFDLHVEKELFGVCSVMVRNKALEELVKERVYQELLKLFTQAKRPSKALRLLKKFGNVPFFTPLFCLEANSFEHTLSAIDNLAKNKVTQLALYFSALALHVNDKEEFVRGFTCEKKLLKKVQNILSCYQDAKEIAFGECSDYEVGKLATKCNIEEVCTFLEALFLTQKSSFSRLRKKAKKLGVLTKAQTPLITGKELIKAGLTPSKEFKEILERLYELQLQKNLNKEELLGTLFD